MGYKVDVVMRKPYKPRKGQQYFMINSRFDVKQTENTGSQKAKDRIKVGNAFKTREEADKFREWVIDLAGHGYYLVKVEFDKRIAFCYGLLTGAFVVFVILWQVMR